MEEYTVYRVRWYILAMFSVLALSQSLFWVTFSAVTPDAREFFAWDMETIEMMLAWGPIFYILSVFVVAWAFATLNMRSVVLMAACLQFTGVAIRLLGMNGGTGSSNGNDSFSIFIVSMGQILNAMSGPIGMGGAVVISGMWFPQTERIISTAVMVGSNNFGIAVGFVLGPYLVTKFGFAWYLYIECALAGCVLIWVFCHFEDRPPTPPSRSAMLDAKREKISFPLLLKNLRELCANSSFLLLSVIAGWQAGMFSTWLGMFDYFLLPEGYTVSQIGWIVTANIVGSTIGNIASGYLVKRYFKQQLLQVAILCFFLGTLCMFLFAGSFAIYEDSEPILSNSPFFIVSYIIFIGIFFGSALPIFYEYGVELTYPLHESSFMLTLAINIGALLFLVIVDYIPPRMMNLCLSFSMLVCSFLLFRVQGEYKRSQFDADKLEA